MSVPLEKVETFEPDGRTFGAMNAAEDWILRKNWSIGPQQRDAPRGIYCGEAYIAKWRNISARDKKELDGEMRFPDGDSRTGRVEIWMRPKLEDQENVVAARVDEKYKHGGIW